AERIRVLLELVADREIAELRRIAIPADRVAARPIAARLCADLERHADAIAGVEPRSAYFCQIPVGSEIARAPFRIGLEPPAREDDRLGAQLTRLALLPHAHAANTAIVREQRNRAGLVEHLNALARRRLVQRLDEPRPAARGLDGEPAPELELAADLERLPTVDRHETHALTTQPLQRRVAPPHQELDEIGIAAMLGDARHVVEILVLGVGAEVRGALLLLGKIGNELDEIVDGPIGDTDRAGRERRVSAALGERRALEHGDARARFARGERRTQRGIAGA